jgi:hypothetical protein
MVLLLVGAVVFVLFAFAIFAGWQMWRRPTRIGAHSRPAPKKRVPEPEVTSGGAAADRVVRSHHVLSDRLMDAPTGRLQPSARHRVPPWVA